MLKKHMAACLVVAAFAALPALAQTSPAPSGSTDRPTATGSGSTATGSSAMQPGASGGSSAMGSSAVGQSGMQGQFMTRIQPNQIMASKLIGTRVMSTNNEAIGDVNDVIVDRNGQAVAAVVGVGGFLGIGEKDVAVPFNALEFADNRQPASGNVTTTGSTTSGTSGGTGAMSGNTPDRVVLRMTKAELQAAPSFNADGNAADTGGATGATSPQQ